MKKRKPAAPHSSKPEESPEISLSKILEDLEFKERTQAPPSQELISRLNRLASKPPFSYTHKMKKNDPR